MESGLFQGPPCLDDELQATLYLRLARFSFTLPKADQIPKILISSSPSSSSSESSVPTPQDGHLQLPVPSSVPPSPLSTKRPRRYSDGYLLPQVSDSTLGFASIEEFGYDGRSSAKPFATILQTLLLVASLSTIGILASFGSFFLLAYLVTLLAKLLQT